MEKLQTAEQSIPDDSFDELPAEHHRKRRRRRGPVRRFTRAVNKIVPWRAIFTVIVVLVVVVAGGQVVLLADAVNQLNGSFGSTMRVVNTISGKSGTDLTLNDFERLQRSVRDLSRSLNRVDGRLRYVRGAAALNPDWQTLLEALAVSQDLTGAADNILSGLEPVLFYMVDGQRSETVVAQISSGERIVELLSIGRGRFDRASAQLRTARNRIDQLQLADVSPGILLQVRSLESYLNQLDEINQVLIQAPTMLTTVLGLEQTQTYLILSQNSDELRPSGGYISTWGWMTVRNGRIVDYAYFPTTVDSPQPPPFEYESGVPVPPWWIQYRSPIYAMWDGSWYASFPRTAEMARIFYNLGGNPNTPVSGVIAIDIRGFEQILGALGSVTVPRAPEEEDGDVELVTITANNFRNIIYDIRAEESAHKDFIADMYNEIFMQWQSRSGDPRTSQELLGVILEALLQKHIMVYSEDTQINQAIQILGWSGKQEPALDHDYLMIADANLGNKSNRSIIRRTTYDVIINDDDTLTGRVSVSYDYPDSIARHDPAIDPRFHGPLDYNNLLQIFTPRGSALTGSENFGGDPFTVDESGHTIFVSRVRIEYDTTGRYQVRYETPALVDTIGPYRRYRLLIQKQPGMLPEKVDVQISLPSGARIVSMSPQPDATYDLDNLILDFRLDLTSDLWLEIIFE